MTPYLDIQNLTKRFGARVLFEDISFSIAEGQKVGLIAQNGTGKSTLMSILTGREGYESGSIIWRNDLRIGFLEQSPKFDPEESVLDACFNHQGNEEKVLRAKQILTQLHITDLQQPMGQLSGGQQKRVALANALLNDPDFLLLDEPTNHLDLEMIVWLEGYLSRSNLTLLMVTHDRYFLDHVCNIILELADNRIYSYRGNYSYYLDKRQERIDNQRAEIARANNLYRTELEWMRRMPQARGHKARYREEAFYELEAKAKQRIEDRQMRLKASNVYIGSKIFECQYVSKKFEDNGQEKVILDNFYYNFARFEKMGIVGNNGTGKSTFVKMLLGLTPSDSGKFDIGETVRFGYFSQEGLKFDENEKVIDVITDIADYIDLGGGRKMTASQFLNYFMIPPEEQHNYVYKLSGGERRKLYLCTVLMRNPNFLVLDEPTNDLDIQTLQVLEEYLQDFPGCVIIISHDREFLDRATNTTWAIENGKLERYGGNYSFYETQRIEKMRLQDAAAKAYERQASHLAAFIERFRYKATKARQAQSRIKMLDKLQAVEPVRARREWRFEFPVPERTPEHLIDIEHLTLGYGEHVVLKDVTLTIRSGDRVGVLGVNGAGKSTLIKAIAGTLEPMSGTLRRGQGLVIGYFAQHQLEQLDLESTPLEVFKHKAPTVREQELRDWLGRFRFSGDFADTKIRTFSGGEKARLALSLIAWDKPNLLVLDEPTNHLDMATREALTMALSQFEGALLLVSHDRHLLRSTCDSLILVHDGSCGAYDGDLDDYAALVLEHRKSVLEADRQSRAVPQAEPQVNRREERRQAAQERAQKAALKKPLLKKLADLEKRMNEGNAKLAELDAKIADSGWYASAAPEEVQTVMKERGLLADEVAKIEEEWLTVSEEIEAIG